ncbi:PQQ-binding-like beta-propeller repeat protein [Streptomyces sp. YC504]|uniref:PQQ-binding-like beta-propeller repeat protein n=2 Tax=Streptomyces mesophilus TaxID=1775132 RepID=A0A6G4XVU2_9ACTN|nr:PQQ-binding-like beta-propeller repeat protein [Streptomyces mesophilus]
MAPEQATGSSAGDAATDVYALGALLVLTATGRPPRGEGEPAEVLYRIAHEEPRLDSVPDGLRPLVTACLAREPAARPTPAEIRELAGAGGWFGDRLPPAVLADIGARTAYAGSIGVRRHTAQAPGPARPTRRALLAGAAALAVAGAGGAAWWAVKDDSGPVGGPAPKPSRSSPSRDTGGAPQPLWTYRGDLSDKVYVPALPFGDLVLAAGSDEGTVIGIDAKSGTARWTARAGVGSAPIPCAGAVVQPTDEPDGRLAVIEAADGRTWISGPLGLDPRRMLLPIIGSSDRLVIVMGHAPGADPATPPEELDRGLVAYDVKDRKVIWRRSLGRSPARIGHMSGDDRYAVLLETDAVTAYRTATGKPLWRRELSTDHTYVDPFTGDARRAIATDHRTVVISGRGCLVLDIATGRTVWSVDPEEAEQGLREEQKGRTNYGAATIDGDELFMAFLGREMWVVKRGTRKRARKGTSWRWKSTVPLAPPPAMPPYPAGKYLFPPLAETADLAAIAVDPRTMKTAWTYTMPSEPTGAIRYMADKNRLYISRGTTLTVLPLNGA